MKELKGLIVLYQILPSYTFLYYKVFKSCTLTKTKRNETDASYTDNLQLQIQKNWGSTPSPQSTPVRATKNVISHTILLFNVCQNLSISEH